MSRLSDFKSSLRHIFISSYNSSMDDQDRFAELHLLLAQARHHVQNAENSDLMMERKLRLKLEQQLAEEKSKRDELVEEQVQMREKNNPAMSNMVRRQLPTINNGPNLIMNIDNFNLE